MNNIPMKTLTIDGRTYRVFDKAAVHFDAQDLTPDQQAQARTNIGLDFAGHARKLLYVNADGNIAPVFLGEGLKIVNGVLALDIDIIESLQSLVSSDGYVLLDSNGLYLKPKEVTE